MTSFASSLLLILTGFGFVFGFGVLIDISCVLVRWKMTTYRYK